MTGKNAIKAMAVEEEARRRDDGIVLQEDKAGLAER
jgi:hypothetical protein